MSLTVALRCGHGLQLRNGKDTHEENLPEHGPWTFYPLDDEHPVEPGDVITCLVCGTSQSITGVSPELIPMNDSGRLTL
jgi:hypothetical protein